MCVQSSICEAQTMFELNITSELLLSTIAINSIQKDSSVSLINTQGISQKHWVSPTGHFISDTYTPAHSHNYLVSQSCGGSTMHKIIYSIYRSRASWNVHIKHKCLNVVLYICTPPSEWRYVLFTHCLRSFQGYYHSTSIKHMDQVIHIIWVF